MIELPQSAIASADRPLAIRAREDLTASRQSHGGRGWWIVKDPLALKYFRLEDEEHAVLRLLNGRRSPAEVQRCFHEEFRGQRISLSELQQFLASLHRSGLVVSDAPGQGEELRRRSDERRRKRAWGTWTNVLCVRFRGVNPDRLLATLYPFVRWAYSPLAVCLAGLLAIAALLLVMVQFGEFQSRLPGFRDFFWGRDALWLLVALAAAKVMHEFGHAFTAKHFGGECNEIGVLVLVLTPCLYCNVSDSWMLSNKWHRAAIGAGGMYVEVVLASLCTFLWWFSEPGLFNHLCLSTMFVCSLSTLVFNGNPLMRFDGYYILSDLIEVPNLRQKSSQILERALAQGCLGIEPVEDPFLPRRRQWLYALYAMAAFAYRAVVVVSILWFLHLLVEPYRLHVVGYALWIACLGATVSYPGKKVLDFLRVPGRTRQLKPPRVWATALVACALVAAAFIPLPHHVFCAAETRLRYPSVVFVEVPGVLHRVLRRPGDRVRKGDTLAELQNYDLLSKLSELENRYAEEELRLENLHRDRVGDSALAAEIPRVEELLKSLRDQRRQLRERLEGLILRAPASGTVFAPPETPPRAAVDGLLPVWSGTPFDEVNLGCTLESGVQFCQIADPSALSADLVIDQSSIELIEPRQMVEIVFEHAASETCVGVIEEISDEELQFSSTTLSKKSGGDIATETDPSGRERPLSASYRARVLLADEAQALLPGLRGRAKVRTAPQSAAARLSRLLAETFRIRL